MQCKLMSDMWLNMIVVNFLSGPSFRVCKQPTGPEWPISSFTKNGNNNPMFLVFSWLWAFLFFRPKNEATEKNAALTVL